MGILSVEHNRINLDDVNFDDIDLMTCHNRLQQQKVFKKKISIELISVGLHPIRWWDWCMTEDKKKK